MILNWVALILCLVLLFCLAIGFWWASHAWKKHNKNKEKEQTQEYYAATTDEPDIEFPGGQIKEG